MSLKVLLVVCALACAVSADVLVDDFSFTSPLISLAPSAPTFNSVRGTNIIGGERDVFISGQSSGCSSAYPEATVDGKLEAFLLSNPSSARTTCQASATSQYDGNDNSRNLQMGLNLNLASATGVEVIVANDDFSGIRYSLKFYSSASRVCTNTFEHVGRGSTNPDTRTFPISAFRGNCDLSNIGAIEIVLLGGLDIDQNIQYFKILQPSAGQVTVTVFDDCDCSGSRDNGEALRSSIQVNVAGKGSCNSFSTTANTNSNGVVTFGNLVGGCQYTFSVNQQTCSRSASSQTVSVVAGQARAVNFALFCPPQVGDVRGVVFSDCNCNGQQESGDNGVPSVTVTVTPSSSACSSATSTRTNSNGQFSFTGLRACTYTVSVNSPTCGSQSTSKSIDLVSGTTSTLVFSTSGETCTIVPPNAVSVKCGDSTKESNTGSPTITGNCKAVVSDSAAKQVCDANVCGFASSFTRTWTISSQCTGTRSVTQTISIGACAPGKCPACDNSSPPDNNGNSPVAPASPRGPISPVIVGRRGSITCRRVCSNSDSSSSSDSSTAATVVMSLSLAIVALLAALLL